MKIIDSTTIIAIFNELKCPDLIYNILKLKHELVITSFVINEELLDKTTLDAVNNFVKSGQIRISCLNSIEEIKYFQKSYPGLGLGECDTMLTHQKTSNDQESVYCIFDDGKARSTAENLKIEFTGLLGLLQIMHSRKIMTKDDADKVIVSLKRSNFRIPEDFVI